MALNYTEKQMLTILLPQVINSSSFNELFQIISIVKRHKPNFITPDEIKEMVRTLSIDNIIKIREKEGKEVNFLVKTQTEETALKIHSKYLPKILEFLSEQNFKSELIFEDPFDNKKEDNKEEMTQENANL